MDTRRVRKVTFIPAIKPLEAMSKKRRVAAYARVSTGSEEQETSLVAQRDYYEKLIQKNDEWVFVEVYYDDGISGLTFRNREGFNRMVADALDGKIDLIISKSISRFARNTVDTLTTIRKLKDAGVEVFFEKENIYTFDSKGEFLITLMSSLAQEESRSISENVTWGKRKHFADGKYEVAFSTFWGYEKGNGDERFVINEEQAMVVRLIYALFLGGHSSYSIRAILNGLEIPIIRGDKGWRESTIESILSNEKYKGDALLQKCFTVDYLTKRTKKNNGEVPQYYLEKVHPAIVSDEIFDLAQATLKMRSSHSTKHYSGTDAFSSKIICPSCGGTYGLKPMHKYVEDRLYYHEFWRCKAFYENKCGSPKIRDETVRGLFILALDRLFDKYLDVWDTCLTILEEYVGEEAIDRLISFDDSLSCEYSDVFYLEKLARTLVDKVPLTENDELVYTFVDGTKYKYKIERKCDSMILTTEKKEKIREMRLTGLGYGPISKIIGVKEATVKSYCIRAGLGGVRAIPGMKDCVCKNCGVHIEQIPHKRKKLYCSDKCRMQAWYKAKSKK